MRAHHLLAVAGTAAVLTAASLTAADASPTPTTTGGSGDSVVAVGPATTPKAPDHAAGTQVRWQVAHRVCSAEARPGYAQCLAEVIESATPDTVGAQPTIVHPGGVGRGPAGGYTPRDLARVYHYRPSAKSGKHMTIGIVDAFNNRFARRDLNTFDKHYGIHKESKHSFVKVNQHGGRSSFPRQDSSWDLEIALDIQTARAVCRHCRILLVEAKTNSFTNFLQAENTAVRMGADVVSNSFAGPEFRATKKIRKAFRHPGVPILTASGDDGWFGWDYANEPRGKSNGAANFPATDPDVISVGGTSLHVTKKGERRTERVWNRNGKDNRNAVRNGRWITSRRLGAAGSGCSRIYKAPHWQRNAKGYNALGCKGKRSSVDVAALADPYTGFDIYNSYDGGWEKIGGTSLASPLVASMWALAGGAKGAVNPGQSLYLRSRAGKAQVRFDVTKGGTGWCGGDNVNHCSKVLRKETTDGHGHHGNGNPNRLNNRKGHPGGLKDCSFPYNGSKLKGKGRRDPECNAVKGFDGIAGIGVPKNLGLFVPTNPKLGFLRPKNPLAGFKQKYKAVTKARYAHDKMKSFVWKWGDHKQLKTKRRSVHHTYKKPGIYHITLTVTDKYGQQTRIHSRIHVRKHHHKHGHGLVLAAGSQTS